MYFGYFKVLGLLAGDNVSGQLYVYLVFGGVGVDDKPAAFFGC